MRFVLTSLGTKPAPEVAVFSSRGPDPINPAILKPDVIAPGVDVLAAVPPFTKIKVGDYELVTDYAFKSGTSLAAPHVSGVAALLKAVHPDWSPAAIRSALMTTAYTINNNGTTLTNQFYVVVGSRVEPTTLTFTKKYQKLSFTVSVEIDGIAPPETYGYLKWIDQRNRTISSPIVVLIS
ncbi:hypothetical protein DITRI_Ditri03aG0191800 [Diplodiscus trichospermus]